MERAFIYGDSLLKATVPDENMHYRFHLPEVMAQYPTDRLEVVNRAKMGATVTKGLSLVEHDVQRGMDALMKGRTTFVIAHRLSTIMYADKILMLEDGSISAAGTHEQLLSSSQTYLDMWKAHISAMDWSMNKEVEILC